MALGCYSFRQAVKLTKYAAHIPNLKDVATPAREFVTCMDTVHTGHPVFEIELVCELGISCILTYPLGMGLQDYTLSFSGAVSPL
jgi:hypothetical protein